MKKLVLICMLVLVSIMFNGCDSSEEKEVVTDVENPEITKDVLDDFSGEVLESTSTDVLEPVDNEVLENAENTTRSVKIGDITLELNVKDKKQLKQGFLLRGKTLYIDDYFKDNYLHYMHLDSRLIEFNIEGVLYEHFTGMYNESRCVIFGRDGKPKLVNDIEEVILLDLPTSEIFKD